MTQPAAPDSADWERRWTITGTENTPSRRLLERQGFHLTGPLPGTDEVRYTLSLG